MPTYTRKQFLGLGAVLAGGTVAARLPIAAAQEPAGEALRADLAVIDARVYTVDDAPARPAHHAQTDAPDLALAG